MSNPRWQWFGKAFGTVVALVLLFWGSGPPLVQAAAAPPGGAAAATKMEVTEHTSRIAQLTRRLTDHPSRVIFVAGETYRLQVPVAQNVALTPRQVADFVQRIVELTNQERSKYGLAPLSIDPALNASAQAHSQDMADHNYFSHTGLDGSEAGQRMAAAGYSPLWAYGENIAAGQPSPEEAFNAWMNSEGHRANILSPYFCDIGVGYAFNAGTTYGHYWTQHLACRGNNPTQPAAAPEPVQAPADPLPSATPIPPEPTPTDLPPTAVPVPPEPTPTPVPPTPTPTPQRTLAPGPIGTADARRIVQLVNEERARYGRAPLALDLALCQAAQTHSDDMALQGFFGHAGSDGSTVEQRVDRYFGPVAACSESIAAGQPRPEVVVKAWMANATTRQRLLGTRYTQVGLGYTFNVKSRYGYYWTIVLAVPNADLHTAVESISNQLASPGLVVTYLEKPPLFVLGSTG